MWDKKKIPNEMCNFLQLQRKHILLPGSEVADSRLCAQWSVTCSAMLLPLLIEKAALFVFVPGQPCVRRGDSSLFRTLTEGSGTLSPLPYSIERGPSLVPCGSSTHTSTFFPFLSFSPSFFLSLLPSLAPLLCWVARLYGLVPSPFPFN